MVIRIKKLSGLFGPKMKALFGRVGQSFEAGASRFIYGSSFGSATNANQSSGSGSKKRCLTPSSGSPALILIVLIKKLCLKFFRFVKFSSYSQVFQRTIVAYFLRTIR